MKSEEKEEVVVCTPTNLRKEQRSASHIGVWFLLPGMREAIRAGKDTHKQG